MTTHTTLPLLALDEVAAHLDAVPPAVGPALVLGLDADDNAHWWTPRAVGHLEVISATGAGRTSLARALVAQLARQTPIPDTAPRPIGPESIPTVTVVGQDHEWRPLVDADYAAPVHPSDLALIPGGDLDVVVEVVTTLADRVRNPRPTGPDRYRFLVVDDAARVLAAMRESLAPARVDAVRNALQVIKAQGPDAGVYTVTTHTPPMAPAASSPVRRAVVGLSRAQAARVLPGAAAPADRPGWWHVADHAVPGAAAPVLVRSPLVQVGPDLARFLAG